MKLIKLTLSDSAYKKALELAGVHAVPIEAFISSEVEDLLDKKTELPYCQPTIEFKSPAQTSGLAPNFSSIIPDSLEQIFEVSKYVYRSGIPPKDEDHARAEFRDAVRLVAKKKGIEETTVRDKCCTSRRLGLPDVPVNTDTFIMWLCRPELLRDHLCRKFVNCSTVIHKQFADWLPARSANTLVPETKKRPPKIVVVDDEPSFLILLEAVIHNRFKEAIVLKFSEGEQAWLELLRATPDFLITDLERQSKMNGWEMIPLLAERKVECPILLLSGSTRGNDLQQKVTLALNGKDEILLGKIQAREFKDEDFQHPTAWSTPSDVVQNLIRRVSPPLNITFLAKPFDTENLIKILETGLKIH